MSRRQGLDWRGAVAACRSVLNDLALCALIVAVVALIVLPVPIIVLDTLLAVNISLSLLLLMAALLAHNALDLSTFPSLLLFTTLLRLSLNIASTKAILLHADAGHVIETFGQLVMGGNIVVGLVVFVIITVVQFIVISKGSERVAEVGARFTLDALPGKQMAIDADLRAGHLTGEQARIKRMQLGMEAQFHGGMDGAMKFVKGDAISSLLITVVNMTAGIATGVLYHGMTAGQAANRFCLLSIGDAMVSSLPSLFICISAGVLITRVEEPTATEAHSLSDNMMAQVGGKPRNLLISALLVAGLAAIPGFPPWPFLLIAGGLVWAGLRRRGDAASSALQGPALRMSASMRDGAKGDVPGVAHGPPTFTVGLSLRLGAELARSLDFKLLNRELADMRQQVQASLGAPFPGMHLWVDAAAPAQLAEVLVQDVPVWHLELPAGCVWLADEASPHRAAARAAGPMLQQATSWWLPAAAAPQDGSCLRPEAAVVRVLAASMRRSSHQFMGVQETMSLLERASADYPGLVAEVQKLLSTQKISEVLRRLLEEQVPIRNVRAILEALLVNGPREKDVAMLAELVRVEMGPQIAHLVSDGTGILEAALLSAQAEGFVRQNLKSAASTVVLAASPEAVTAFHADLRKLLDQAQAPGKACLVTSLDIRRHVHKLAGPVLEGLKVLSYQELEGHAQIRSLGQLMLEGPG